MQHSNKNYKNCTSSFPKALIFQPVHISLHKHTLEPVLGKHSYTYITRSVKGWICNMCKDVIKYYTSSLYLCNTSNVLQRSLYNIKGNNFDVLININVENNIENHHFVFQRSVLSQVTHQWKSRNSSM